MPEIKTLRYAVVGLGWIAQEAVLPAFKHSAHSQLAALVTGDAVKATDLASAYNVPAYGYQDFDRLLSGGDIDAVYISLPNSMHAEYATRAAEAGIHVLCEKPMAASSRECEQMIQTAESSGACLMIAYRLHFEPANLKAIEIIQSGAIGEPRTFSSSFSQNVKSGDIRLKANLAGGPLMDMGIYQINAARYLFREEPVEVAAFATRPSNDARFQEVNESVSVMLRFPGDRLAGFAMTFGGAPSDEWELVGTKGSLSLRHAFEYHQAKELVTTIGGKEHKQSFSKRDQFGGEIEYFSECILGGRQPEPSGAEGLADIRIIEALTQSISEGRPISIPPYELDARPSPDQEKKLWPVKAKKIVRAAAPTGD